MLALAGSFILFANSSKAETFQENFSSDPAANGWRIFGDTNLFHWNSTNQNLEVTWDSSQTNSYFYRPLGTILAQDDDFSLAFDLQLSDAEVGGYGFEIAIGFLNLADATSTNFIRGTGTDSPNLVEFDYFPDAGFGTSITATMTDTNSTFQFIWDSLPLVSGNVYHITLTHLAGAPMIGAEVSTNGQLCISMPYAYLSTNFTDFRADTISISSYNDVDSGGSILAHGVVDNFVITTPPPPVGNLTGGFTNQAWQVQFLSRSNWLYSLERTADFQTWMNVSPAISGNGTNLVLQDTNPPADRAFYRIRAERP